MSVSDIEAWKCEHDITAQLTAAHLEGTPQDEAKTSVLEIVRKLGSLSRPTHSKTGRQSFLHRDLVRRLRLRVQHSQQQQQHQPSTFFEAVLAEASFADGGIDEVYMGAERVTMCI